MYRRVKKHVLNHLYQYLSLYFFMTVLLVTGIVFGAIIVNSLSLAQKEDLFVYLSRFFSDMSQTQWEQAAGDMFNQSFTHYLKYFGLMWLLGISIIGVPLILVLLFLKGVVVGFTVGFLVQKMQWKGLFLAFVSVLPQNLLLVPTFLFLATVAVIFSLTMIKQQFQKPVPFFPLLKRYVVSFLGVSVVMFMASLYEAYLSPALMKLVLHLFS